MQTFLHVGCGHNYKDQTTPGFNSPDWNEVRFDIDASVHPDFTGTMTNMSGVADASVDAVFSSALILIMTLMRSPPNGKCPTLSCNSSPVLITPEQFFCNFN